ncbi:hypothetical protein AX16_001128 [Volvariella volvacea WC 439]|nr:hypothetical protein AX16_001128 [Volvariella volvacea WC 439]
MFKKPLGGLKTSAPLRSSDRKKLKQRVISTFNISPEVGDLLVPDGILSVKFTTHLNEPGTAYLAPGSNGDPLWFSIGKSATEELVPTVYTLWKESTLLPFVSTPAAVIPILTGGADLMIPGVIHYSKTLQQGQLVAVSQFSRTEGQPTLSPPLAVGRMAVSGEVLSSGTRAKGKAVNMLHTWKDHLWTMGSKSEVPESKALQATGEVAGDDSDEAEGEKAEGSQAPKEEKDGDDAGPADKLVDDAIPPPKTPPPGPAGADDEFESIPVSQPAASPKYTPQNISELLHASLLQAIQTTLKEATFPMSSTQLYSGYILPARPSYPPAIVPLPLDAVQPASSDQEISIKTSSHKSLSAFLKQAEKASLLTLKSHGGDFVVLSVNTSHPQVQVHKPFVTVKDIQDKAAKKAAREEKEHADSERKKLEVGIVELWKPHLSSVELFKAFGASTTELYTIQEIRSLLIKYIEAKGIANQHDRAYVNVDETLYTCITTKGNDGQSKKAKEAEPAGNQDDDIDSEFMRQELLSKIMKRMQRWHEISAEGHDTVRKKGEVQSIQVVMKMRQGRKASTLITGFEPFLVINAEEMAEDLRKICAGATSVSPIPGKPANSGSEVFVQGKQSKTVVDYLIGKGIPKKWIEVQDQVGKKK